MLLPIGTDVRLHSPPLGNWLLIALNVVIYIAADGFHNPTVQAAVPPLHAGLPALHEYITYQFRHGDIAHLLGNMAFLWIFGNAVCDRMGSLNYVIFYLAAGVFAGVTFAAWSHSDIVGASGAIAAVTTAFLVFYPRVHITLLLWFFIVTTLQLPAMTVIVLKIILWDNIVAPALDRGMAANVAYSAHLGGYLFGFAVAMGLLAARALPRNQFDLLAIVNRWRRRSGLTAEVTFDPPRPVRPVNSAEIASRPLDTAAIPPILQLREDIVDRMAERDMNEAARLYERMLQLDPRSVLPRDRQLEMAKHLAQSGRYPQAVGAFEAYLAAYPGSAEAARVELFTGLLYSRYLSDFAQAAAHLRKALGGLTSIAEREMALQELAIAEGRPAAS